jgi:pimeloyl-ACP methyl ester carboxylesterase
MDLSKLTQKKLDVSRGFTYTYYTFPAQGSKPTLILFHGWPDTARLWAGSSIISLSRMAMGLLL